MINPYRRIALALLFLVDHQRLDTDAQAVADITRRELLRLERKRNKEKGG